MATHMVFSFLTQFSGTHYIGQILDCLVTSTSAHKRMAQLLVEKKKFQTTLVSNKLFLIHFPSCIIPDSHLLFKTTQKEKIAFPSLLPGMLVKATAKQVSWLVVNAKISNLGFAKMLKDSGLNCARV